MIVLGLAWVALSCVTLFTLYQGGNLFAPVGFAAFGVALGIPMLVAIVTLLSNRGGVQAVAVAPAVAMPPVVQAAPTPAGPSMFDGLGGWLGGNALYIAGTILFLLALVAGWGALYQENWKPLLGLGFILLFASAACFLVAKDKLGDTLQAWARHGLLITGFLASLVALVWIAHDGYLDGFVWWKMPEVRAAAFVVSQFALAVTGLFVPFWSMVGSIIVGALRGKIGGPVVAGILWIGIVGVAAFVANHTGKLEIFEDFEDAAKIGELASIGLFIAMFIGIVFGIVGIILWSARNKGK